MSESACCKPRVIEPICNRQPDGPGLALEPWLSRSVDGIAGRALRVPPRRGAKRERAETWRDPLHAIGVDIVVAWRGTRANAQRAAGSREGYSAPGRGSGTKPWRFGIFTCGNDFASSRVDSGTTPFRYSRYALTAYTSSADSDCGALYGIARRM